MSPGSDGAPAWTAGPSTIQNVIPSYLYQEYADDPDLQSFVDAYNAYAQSYVDYANNLNLPVYTNLSGTTLDWVGTNLYGMLRPTLPTQGRAARGELNTYEYNTLKLNQVIPAVTPPFYATSDDVYKRVLTWHFFKGDGKVFSPWWLKRRVKRFLIGLNGTDPPILDTYDISMKWTAAKTATITVPASYPLANIFQSAAAGGILELPFQTTWTIVVH